MNRRRGRHHGHHAADPLTQAPRTTLVTAQPATAPGFTPAQPPATVRQALRARVRLTAQASQPTGIIPALALPRGPVWEPGDRKVAIGPLDPAWLPDAPHNGLIADLRELVIFRGAVHSVFARQEQARGTRISGISWHERFAAIWQRRTAEPVVQYSYAGPLQALHAEARATLKADVERRITAMNGRGAA